LDDRGARVIDAVTRHHQQAHSQQQRGEEMQEAARAVDAGRLQAARSQRLRQQEAAAAATAAAAAGGGGGVAAAPAAAPAVAVGDAAAAPAPGPPAARVLPPASEGRPRRIIFLDCDGVLANYRSQLMDYEDDDPTLIHDSAGRELPLERACVVELARVCEATGAEIVLSTAWRLRPEMRAFLVGALEGAGLQVVGDTPSASEGGRGAEVVAWLQQQQAGEADTCLEVRSFVILDDDHRQSFHDAGLKSRCVETLMHAPQYDNAGEEVDTQGAFNSQEGLCADKADAATEVLLRDTTPEEATLFEPRAA